jgi:FkbM family methyltransferase
VRSDHEERIEKLRRKLAAAKRDTDQRVLKALRHGHAAGPLLEMEYPGADLKLVAASGKRLNEHASEPYIAEWIETAFRPDEVLYDVGANVGTYALIAAARVLTEGRVVAFEPSYSTYAVLCDNVFVNGLGDRVDTFPVALGGSTGVVAFAYSSTRPGAAKHNWPTGTVRYRHGVLGYRLDDLASTFALPPPNHLKIDTDGGEPELLRGARETLRSPELRSVMVELLPWTEEAVVAELTAAGLEHLRTYERPPSPVTCALFARPGGGIS